ncbi:MAG: YdcF family protein [Parcubacteria group bacterium]|nr:YdcF family protein [Parcubacteria group bacterium]MCR4342536.1 YdcF family protein [Patescibacteria group bacterium]
MPENFEKIQESNENIEKEPKPFSTLVLLGGPLKENEKRGFQYDQEGGLEYEYKDGGWQLGRWAKMRAIAASDLIERDLVDKLIITGGKNWGEENPSAAEVMAEFIKRKIEKDTKEEVIFPNDKIILADKYHDTASSLKQVLDDLPKEDIEKITFLTNEFHLKRSKQSLENLGFKEKDIEGIDAEKILTERSDHYKSFVKKFNRTPDTIKQEILEVIGRGIMSVRGEKLIKALADLIRKDKK